MNYKKKNYVEINGSIYNIDNWSRLSVDRRRIGSDKEKVTYLMIELPGSSKALFLSKDEVLNSNYHMVLGVAKEDLEAMFLKFEVKDD